MTEPVTPDRPGGSQLKRSRAKASDGVRAGGNSPLPETAR
jgi:hypothetical protein